jgi:hypothetical protein
VSLLWVYLGLCLNSRRTLDDMPGTLYWADWPDPKSSRPVNSRTAASIDNERGLCSLMRSMGYKYVQFSHSLQSSEPGPVFDDNNSLKLLNNNSPE